jgi:hypothetical protein
MGSGIEHMCLREESRRYRGAQPEETHVLNAHHS